MHFEDMKTDWNNFKLKVKQHWNRLTDDELTTVNGDRAKLEAALVNRYGWTAAEAKDEVDNWCNNSMK